MDAAMLPVPEEQLPMAQAAVDVPAPRPQPAAGSFGDMAARLVDLRVVAKPPTFSGKEADWPEFQFRLESVAALLGCDEAMERVARGGDTELEDNAQSKFLYSLCAPRRTRQRDARVEASGG